MRIYCPHCGTEYEVPEQDFGRKALCEECQNKFIITEDATVVPKMVSTKETVEFRVGSVMCGRLVLIERMLAGIRETIISQAFSFCAKFANLARRTKSVSYIVVIGIGCIMLVCCFVFRKAEIQGESSSHEQSHEQQRETNEQLQVQSLGQRQGIPEGTNTFQYVKDKIAVIKFDDGTTGTGFYLRMADGVYFVSNEHVMRGCVCGRPTITGINGRKRMSAERIEVSRDRDLVRWRCEDDGEDDVPYLNLAENPPNIGDEISIYGNSEGGGVVTEIKGHIQGVSFDRIETDGKFVLGNSGSPLVNSVGKVLGVATLITNDKNDRDWTKKGTRFNDVRRYAERVDVAQSNWCSMPYEKYVEEHERYNDYSYYITRLAQYYSFLLGIKNGDADMVYSELDKKNYRHDDGAYHMALLSVEAAYKRVIDAVAIHDKLIREKTNFAQRLSRMGSDKIEDEIRAHEFKIAGAKAFYIIRRQDFFYEVQKALEVAENSIKCVKFINPQLDTVSGDEQKLIKNALDALNDLRKKFGNVREMAVEHLTSEDKYKRDNLLGSFILYQLGIEGDSKAQALFVKMWRDNLLVDGMLIDGIGEVNVDHLQVCATWFEDSAEKRGIKEAWYVVGCKEVLIDNDIKSGIAHLKNSELCEGFVQAGFSYCYRKNDKLALECFKEAASDRFKDAADYILALEQIGYLRMYSEDENVQSWEEAALIYKRLIQFNAETSENATYLFRCALALWNSTKDIADADLIIRMFRRASVYGDDKIKKMVDEIDFLRVKEAILNRCRQDKAQKRSARKTLRR